jgi:HSP20 family protein
LLHSTSIPALNLVENQKSVILLEVDVMQSLWNPWQELDQIQQEMSRMFGRRTGRHSAPVGYPAVNLWADETQVVLTAEIPGLDPEQLDVTVNRNTIVLSGHREAGQPKEGETYFRRERSAASFSRTLELPIEVDPQSAEAEYAKGVLTLRIARPVRISRKKWP